MTALRAPLRDHAQVPVDSAISVRLWRGVVARRERRVERGRTRSVAMWFAVGALAATVPMLGLELHRGHAAREIVAEAGPVMLASGQPLSIVEGAPGAGATASLSDGSVIAVDSGARVETLENTSRSVVLLLAHGRTTIDVKHGGPRRWSIECGLATVEVVGTRFVLAREPGRLRVEVERGVVLVRGERVRDRVQRLVAGTSLDVAEIPPRPEAAPSPLGVAPAPAPPASAGPPPPRRWRELATRGAYADAYRLLGASGMGAEVAHSASTDDLMALADVARLSGHPADAVAPLVRIEAEHADDPRAPLAAFTLGKIHLSLGDGSVAARDFERAIVTGLPSGLLEDAYGYLVDAKTKAGDVTGARAAAAAYRARFPASERARALSERVGR